MSAATNAVRYLRDYIALPSVNPMGRTDIPDAIAGERRYAEHLREQMRGLGLDAELIGDPQRPSVIAEARVSGATECVLIASHLDTVPVDGMEIDPFEPEVRDQRLYGRGSCDTKGGMAALVAAVEQLLAQGRLAKNVILVGEADEELGSRGAHDVLDKLGVDRPDWAIATEPTGLRVMTAHKGIAIAHLQARGRACHSSRPDEGSNAIVSLARAVLALDELGKELATAPHPRLGPGTLSVGLIEGGRAPNMVPDQAQLVCDRRLLPGEDKALVRAQIEQALAGRKVSDVEIASCELGKPALELAPDHAAVRACQRALGELGMPSEISVGSFGTDAGVFAQVGLPSIVLGPGAIEQAHTAREHVPVSEVEQMTELLIELLSTP